MKSQVQYLPKKGQLLYKKYLKFPIIIFAFILFANIVVNYFVSMQSFAFVKIIGDTNTWISFNGSVIGSIIGGLVAGIIAFNVSKLQVDKENENNLIYRKIELKNSLQVEVSRKILDIIHVLLIQHYAEAKYIINIYEQINEYRKYSIYKDKIENADNTYLRMKDYCRLNLDSLLSETIKDFDYQEKLNHIYYSYTIVILNVKSTYENIMKELLSLKEVKTSIKECCERMTITIESGKDVEDAEYLVLSKLVEEFKEKVNPVIYDLTCFNIDIQNTLTFLFDDKIEKPEYREQL